MMVSYKNDHQTGMKIQRHASLDFLTIMDSKRNKIIDKIFKM